MSSSGGRQRERQLGGGSLAAAALSAAAAAWRWQPVGGGSLARLVPPSPSRPDVEAPAEEPNAPQQNANSTSSCAMPVSSPSPVLLRMGCPRPLLSSVPSESSGLFTNRLSSSTHRRCRRPGTKYCVDLFLFLEHFGTLPPEVIFTSVSSDPTFHHGLCFFASVAAFLFATTHPYLDEYRASTSGTLSGTLAASSVSCCRRSRRHRPCCPMMSSSAAVAAAAAEDALLSRRRWQWAAAAVGCSARRWRHSCAIKLSSGRTVIQRRRRW